MEKELLKVFDDVTKPADAAKSYNGGGGNESEYLEALERLKSFPVSYQLLVSTQVGKHLKNLTKHPRKKVQTAALGLMETRKQIVIQETTTKTDVKKNGKYERTDSLKRQSPKANSPSRPEKVQKTSAVKIEKARFEHDVKPGSEQKTKLTCIPKANDDARDKVRAQLHEALCKVFQEVEADERVRACDPIRVAVTAESVLFERWGSFYGSQKVKYRSLMFNVKDQKNPDFRRKVLIGDIKPERLVDMSSAEMASDERQLENKKMEEKALFECERGTLAAKASTDQLKCGRCGNARQLTTRCRRGVPMNL